MIGLLDGFPQVWAARYLAYALPLSKTRARIVSLDHRGLPPLPVSGTIRRVHYEWDNSKGVENLRKHGVDFADAIAALEDPNRLEEIDDRFVYGEERIRVIGMTHEKVLFVVATLPGENTCRIISARRATQDEQDRYYAGDRETW